MHPPPAHALAMRVVQYSVLRHRDRAMGWTTGAITLPSRESVAHSLEYTASDLIALVEKAEGAAPNAFRSMPHIVVADDERLVRDGAVVVSRRMLNGGARRICIAEILPSSVPHIRYAE